MYKVLLLDTHYIRAMRVHRLINWKQMNCQILLELQDVNASHVLSLLRPDILIIYTELSLIRCENCISEAIANNWDVQVIVLKSQEDHKIRMNDEHIIEVLDGKSLQKEDLQRALDHAVQKLMQLNREISDKSDEEEIESIFLRKIADESAGRHIFYLSRGVFRPPLSPACKKELRKAMENEIRDETLSYRLDDDLYILSSYKENVSKYDRELRVNALIEKLRSECKNDRQTQLTFLRSEAFYCEMALSVIDNMKQMMKRYYFWGGNEDTVICRLGEKHPGSGLCIERKDECISNIIHAFGKSDEKELVYWVEELYGSYLKKRVNMQEVLDARKMLFFFLRIFLRETGERFYAEYYLNRFDTIHEEMQYMKELLTELYTERNGGRTKSAGKGINQRIVRAVEIIYRRYAEPISLESVAEETGITKEYLSKTFHENTGYRFNEFVNEIRIDRVKQLMKENNHMPLSEIASKTGFIDAKYMGKVFRRMTGISPREYHLELQENPDA